MSCINCGSHLACNTTVAFGELGRIGEEAVVAYLMYYSDVVLGKTTKPLNQCSQRPGRDLNGAPPEYKSTTLQLGLNGSVCFMGVTFEIME
jgi:hypothetical protein